MLHAVCYDISNDRRRRKIARLLEGYGVRVQKSVFEARLDQKKLLSLRKKLERRIDPELDSVRIYRICARCRESIEVIGPGTLPEP
ncbi:MAG: CRISPR-associated endonuclease Cas2, partial [Polyangia bacterium]